MFYFRVDIMSNILLILVVDKTHLSLKTKFLLNNVSISIDVGSSYKLGLPVFLLINIVRVAMPMAIYIILIRGLIIHMILVSKLKIAISWYYYVPSGGTTGCSLHIED